MSVSFRWFLMNSMAMWIDFDANFISRFSNLSYEILLNGLVGYISSFNTYKSSILFSLETHFFISVGNLHMYIGLSKNQPEQNMQLNSLRKNVWNHPVEELPEKIFRRKFTFWPRWSMLILYICTKSTKVDSKSF